MPNARDAVVRMPAEFRARADPMRPRIQIAALLVEPPQCLGRLGRILLVVDRAADGWLALDLLGREEARVRGPRGDLRILRGGRAHRDRVFSLHALLADPAEVGALRLPDRVPASFGFGGDLRRLLRRAGSGATRRLLLFRGLSILDPRGHLAPEGCAVARATPELVFETPRENLRERLCAPAVRGVSVDAP